MLTANYLTENKLPVGHVLTEEDKKAIVKENEGKSFSYLCLLKEMFGYRDVTVTSLLNGWGGIQLVKLPIGYNKVSL